MTAAPPRPRVVSLLPSATEMLSLLGVNIVGRSHECDFPDSVRETVPALTGAHNKFESSAQMHEAVTTTLQSGRGLYWLDAERLEALRPDAIVTQSLCSVCAVDLDIVRQAAQKLCPPPRIIDTNPMSLGDVISDIHRLGVELGVPEKGEEVAAALQARIDKAVERIKELAALPTPRKRLRVVFLEWTMPLFPGGHWTPQMIQMAGADCPVNPPKPGGGAAPSRETDPSEVVSADPDLVIIAPCGLGLETTRREVELLRNERWWRRLRAVQSGSVVLVDGNQHFNRPGPRLVDALEWLVGLLADRPDLMPADFPWERYEALPPLEQEGEREKAPSSQPALDQGQPAGPIVAFRGAARDATQAVLRGVSEAFDRVRSLSALARTAASNPASVTAAAAVTVTRTTAADHSSTPRSTGHGGSWRLAEAPAATVPVGVALREYDIMMEAGADPPATEPERVCTLGTLLETKGQRVQAGGSCDEDDGDGRASASSDDGSDGCDCHTHKAKGQHAAAAGSSGGDVAVAQPSADGGCGCVGDASAAASAAVAMVSYDDAEGSGDGTDPWVAACSPWSSAPYLPPDIEDLHAAACDAGKMSYDDPATGYMVFTQLSLVKRGLCCANRCRHCPWGHSRVQGRPRLNRITRPTLLHPTPAAQRAHQLRISNRRNHQQSSLGRLAVDGARPAPAAPAAQLVVFRGGEEDEGLLRRVLHEAGEETSGAGARWSSAQKRRTALLALFDVDSGDSWAPSHTAAAAAAVATPTVITTPAAAAAASTTAGPAPAASPTTSPAAFRSDDLTAALDAALRHHLDLVALPLQVSGRMWPRHAAGVAAAMSYAVLTATELLQEDTPVVLLAAPEDGPAGALPAQQR